MMQNVLAAYAAYYVLVGMPLGLLMPLFGIVLGSYGKGWWTACLAVAFGLPAVLAAGEIW